MFQNSDSILNMNCDITVNWVIQEIIYFFFMIVPALLNKRWQRTLVATIFNYFWTSNDTAKYLVSFNFYQFKESWS